MPPLTRLRSLLVRLLPGLIALVACSRSPTVDAPAPRPVPAPPPAKVAVTDPHRQALARDPEAMDEGLRQALHDLRDKFLCNGVSGCKAERVLVDAGWRVRPQLEQLFAQAGQQASYRTRTVRIIAQLRDPDAEPFLATAMTDKDPEVQAFAIWGLGLLDARGYIKRITRFAHDEGILWRAPPRLTALWVLHLWGDAQAGVDYLRWLKDLSQQQMAAVPLTWAAELCMDPRAPDCSSVLPAIARHPGFLARRQAVRAMAAKPARGQEAVLIEVAADHVRSSADLAEAALRQLTGQNLQGAAAWQQWCAQVDCQSWEPK